MGRWIGLVLPGLPQLLRREAFKGTSVLLLWLGLLVVGLTRFDRVTAAFDGGLHDRVALLTLFIGLIGAWWWSFRDDRSHRIGRGEVPYGSGAGQGVWEAFRRNRMAVLGLGIILTLYLVMLLTPFLAPFEPELREAYQPGGDASRILNPPSVRNIMGTDQYSQDVFSRILYGARISLSIGLLAVGISVTLGGLLGAIAGYLGGRIDWVIMRAVDVVMAFPKLVLIIVIVAVFFPASLFVIVVALAFTQWPFMARMVRGEILSLKEREFTEAARALGFSRRRILFRHLLPNAVGPLTVVAALGIGNAIVLEAGLSFLGLGVQGGHTSWGKMVFEGRDFLLDEWWIATFPGLAIVLAVLAFNLVGDGLRDALDPRQGGGAGP